MLEEEVPTVRFIHIFIRVSLQTLFGKGDTAFLHSFWCRHLHGWRRNSPILKDKNIQFNYFCKILKVKY